MNIVIYSKSGCVNCRVAKDILNSKGIGYAEFDTDNLAWRTELLQRNPSVRQMPAIYINEQFVGGLAGLQAALKQVGL
jgi:glutaredoxin 3